MLPQLNTKFAFVVIAGLSTAVAYKAGQPTQADECVDLYVQSWKKSNVTMTVSGSNLNQVCETMTGSKVGLLRRQDFTNFTFGK